jgi:hypothetical protein
MYHLLFMVLGFFGASFYTSSFLPLASNITKLLYYWIIILEASFFTIILSH